MKELGGQIDSLPEKLPSKSPALLGLNKKVSSWMNTLNENMIINICSC